MYPCANAFNILCFHVPWSEPPVPVDDVVYASHIYYTYRNIARRNTPLNTGKSKNTIAVAHVAKNTYMYQYIRVLYALHSVDFKMFATCRLYRFIPEPEEYPSKAESPKYLCGKRFHFIISIFKPIFGFRKFCVKLAILL